jgi:hypothetical protein
MDRFQQQTASDLAANYARNRFAEEIYNSQPVFETSKCQSCSESFLVHELELVVDGTDEAGRETALFCCPACKIRFEQSEPECECVCVGDQADASGCQLHGPNRWAPVMVAAGVSSIEADAFLAWIDRKPSKIDRIQGELFPEVA